MCRWFAYISPGEPCLLEDVLVDPENAISKQCSEHYLPKLLPHGGDHDLHDAPDKLLKRLNSLLNMDGMGMAWYTSANQDFVKHVAGQRPAMYKSPSPPINDFNFRSLCANTQSSCLFAHIRASSGTPVAVTNCHPFVFGRHVFMHNGTITSFSRIRRELSSLLEYDAFCNVAGSTDSEHAAALYMVYLTGSGDKTSWEKEYSLNAMHDAMVKTVTTIMKLQRDILKQDMAASSMNFCATDGTKLVAIRFRNHKSEQPPSLYWSDTAGRTLNRKYPGNPNEPGGVNAHATKAADEHGRHVIVASEPTTFDEDEWHLIRPNHAFIVDADGSHTEEPIVYDPALNATDPNAPLQSLHMQLKYETTV